MTNFGIAKTIEPIIELLRGINAEQIRTNELLAELQAKPLAAKINASKR